MKSIANAGISELDIVTTTVRNEDRLRAFLVDAVIVSPGRKREIEACYPGDGVSSLFTGLIRVL